MEQVGFWRKIIAHPSYDEFWQDQAMDKLLAKEPLTVPTMLVHSLWDQEDIYAAPAVYRAIKPKDTDNQKVFLVMGPWHHGQEIEEASSLGAIKFNTDTGLYFREHILRPFLAQYLKDGAPKADLAPVTAYETGTNEWQRLPSWPPAASACRPAVSGGGRQGKFCCAQAGGRGVHGICVGPGETGPVSGAADPADGVCGRADVVGVAGG